ncbi:MAG: HPt (histidine-containing phosphotransfer) domain-containing protein [Bacteriovoracaceae bacterium]|jgi:HPt (histidine-containing phosphotransfer) domain-containing protein
MSSLNQARIEVLKGLGDHFLLELFQTAQSSLNKNSQVLALSIQDGITQEIKSSSHSLKSILLNIGADSAASLASEIETHFQEANKVKDLFNSLIKELQVIDSEIKTILITAS